jgi:hypothetical protein
MIRRADERPARREFRLQSHELGERVHFPRQVIQPDGAAARARRCRLRADLEQAEVVIVR